MKKIFTFLFVLLILPVGVSAEMNGWMSQAMNYLNNESAQVSLFDNNESDVSENVEEELVQKENEEYRLYIDGGTVDLDRQVSAFDGELMIEISSSTLATSTNLEVVRLNEQVDEPWRLKKISDVFQVEFDGGVYNSANPVVVEINFKDDFDKYKQIFYWDRHLSVWKPLPGQENVSTKKVRAQMHLNYARLAVFSYPEVLIEGKASWYAYKGGDFTASPDFPKGSQLLVTNLDNGKELLVTVNDWGPERDLFPDRAIDLDKVAFSKLASLGAGIIDVRVEPIFVPDRPDMALLDKAYITPQINASAAVVLDEKDNSIVYNRNATTSLPIASLTKLISIKTFFDTRPSLNQEVEYLDEDELQNHRYVDQPWRIARLKLDEGDKVTLEDLLYSALVGSYNNIVETIVRVSGLTRDQFVVNMNENISNWGARSTHLIEPTGLSPSNISTALDYAIITKELFKNPLIKKSSSINKYTFTPLNSEDEYRVVNRNHLVLKNTYRIAGTKTGYLDEAGYCLMTRVKTPDNNHLTVVLLGAESRDESMRQVEDLIQYGLKRTGNSLFIN